MGWATHYIERLKNGETVSFRPKGNSMTGRIESKQLCTVAPLTDDDTLQCGDVVLCTVGGRQFLHLITSIKGSRYSISNNRGHQNGWTGRSQIYGRLVSVEP